MNRYYLLLLLILVIGLVGIGNLQVDITPLDYENDNKTYINEFKNISAEYGNKFINGFSSFFDKINSISNTLSNVFDKIADIYEKATYIPDGNTPGGLEEWQNANIFQKLWWTIVAQFKSRTN